MATKLRPERFVLSRIVLQGSVCERRKAASLRCQCAAQKSDSCDAGRSNKQSQESTKVVGEHLPEEVSSGTKSLILQQWVFGLSTAGLLESGYLTAVKLLDAPLVCPTSGCAPVLNSPYSEVFGIPLSILGMLGYGLMASLSALGLLRKDGNGSLVPPKEILLWGATLLATCSLYFLHIIFSRLGGEPCIWCFGSAALSFMIFAAVLATFDGKQLSSAAGPSAGVAIAAFAALTLGFQNVEASDAREDVELPYVLPEVTTKSDERAVSLARRLKAAGVEMYGAFWCNHCYDQKQAFGQEAMEEFPYVECYPDGYRKGVSVAPQCDAANLKGFPTWIFGDKRIEGEQPLNVLEDALQELEESQANG